MGAAAAPLAALEVAVRGRGAALAGLQYVAVHGDAHRAARLAPFEARIHKDFIEALGLGLGLHHAGARHHHGADAGRELLPLGDRGGGAHILDTAIGAGADKGAVDLDIGDRLVGLEVHIFERLADGVLLLLFRRGGRIGHAAVDRRHILGAGAPGYVRRDCLGVERDILVVSSAGIGGQRVPIFQRRLPLIVARRHRASLDIGEGGLVGGDQAGPGTTLDGHVAHRHAPFHRQPANRRADIFDDMAGAAGGADGADDGEDHVLGGDARRQIAIDGDTHVLGPLLHQGLRRQHMLDFARADAEGEAAQGAMRRGVAVAAHQRDAGLRRALFRPDDMDDALALIEERDQRHIEIGAVLNERLELHARLLVAEALALADGRDDMVGHGEHGVGAVHGAAIVAHALEAGPARHLVGQMHVDIKERRAVIVFRYDMALPYLVE